MFNSSKKAKKQWLDSLVLVLITYLTGILGGHKLYQRKYKVALIYSLTFGILCLGWFYDIFVNMFYSTRCFVEYIRQLRYEAYKKKCKEQKLKERKNKKFRFIK